ncbi:MAG: hypothetical protein CBB60_005350, partial [Armatimonadetes bacterium Cent15-Ar3]
QEKVAKPEFAGMVSPGSPEDVTKFLKTLKLDPPLSISLPLFNPTRTAASSAAKLRLSVE